MFCSVFIIRLFRSYLFLTLLVSLMIVICSFLSLSGFFTQTTEVTYSHYNGLQAHYFEYTPLKQGDCTVEPAVVVTALLWVLKRLAWESLFLWPISFPSLLVQASLDVLGVVEMQLFSMFKMCTDKLGKCVSCVCVVLVKVFLFCYQIFTNISTVAVLPWTSYMTAALNFTELFSSHSDAYLLQRSHCKVTCIVLGDTVASY